MGVMGVVDAQLMARDSGLDLVEVAPSSTPPVCRIMDFGKWKYDQKKREHKSKLKQHQVVLKEVRLRPKIDEHDLSVKAKQARMFLDRGSKVQFTMLFRGRELAHMDLALKLMNSVAEGLEDVGKIEIPPRRQGKRLTLIMTPIGKQAAASNTTATTENNKVEKVEHA